MDTIAFIDGQNLYHVAKTAWLADPSDRSSPYAWASYDVAKLANALAAREPGRILTEIRFYTGVPDESSRPFLHGFWSNKIRYLRNGGIYVYQGKVNAGGEKGVDVSLALDSWCRRRMNAAMMWLSSSARMRILARRSDWQGKLPSRRIGR